MRTAFVLVLSLLAAHALAPENAHARRSRARPGDGPLAIGVAPFAGEGAGGTPMAEALELELELVESVVVKGGRWMKRDLRRAGERAFKPATLKRIMKKRKLDILLGGRAEGGELKVQAYGSDGKPRYEQTFPLPRSVDDRAQQIVKDLAPSLARWRTLRPVSPAPSSQNSRLWGDGVEAAAGDEDLFVDVEDDDAAPRRGLGEGGSRPKVASADAGVQGRWDEEPSRATRGGARAGGERGQRAPTRRRATSDDEGVGSAPSRRRALLGDDDARRRSRDREGRDRDRSDRDRSDRDRPDRDRHAGELARLDRPDTTLDDIERDAAREPTLEKTHFLAVSAGGDFSFWLYDFAGNQPEQSFLLPGFTSFGGGVRADAWPLRWVGLDAELRATFMSLAVKAPPINPADLTALTLHGAVTGKARYILELGDGAVGIGARIGYRYWGRNVDPQTSQADGQPLTVVPGWTLHAAALGLEAYGSYVALERRFEAELRADVLPLAFYGEQPDNPGATSQPIGWSASGLVRIPVLHPVTLEASGFITGASIAFDGNGDRLQRDGAGAPVAVQGGSALNLEAGASISLGLVF